MTDIDCRTAIEELYGYLDGYLDEKRCRDIRHHLDACAWCLGAFDFEAELRDVIARRCVERVPEQLRARIAGQLGQAG